MAWAASMTTGCRMAARDGDIGTGTTSRMRWAVVDTHDWFPGREVLVPVAALGRPDPVRRRLPSGRLIRFDIGRDDDGTRTVG